MTNSPTESGISIERIALINNHQQQSLNKTTNNNSFDSFESDRKSTSPAFEITSNLPPPLVPRRNKKSLDGNNPPPKLPPKPEESLKQRKIIKPLVLTHSDANDLTQAPRNLF